MTELPQILSATTMLAQREAKPSDSDCTRTACTTTRTTWRSTPTRIGRSPAIREEAPLYYNEQHDFYALSRFADVDRALVDHETFSSARGAIIELIKADIDIPPGVMIFEDPPIHDMHRKLLARMFTPRKINDLEPKIREFCAHSLDPFVGGGRFDFVSDLGAQMPMRVIGMLLGVPEEYQEAARDRTNDQMRTEAGKPMDAAAAMDTGEFFAEFIDWRAEHPPTTS